MTTIHGRSGITWRWVRSQPDARTDRLPAVPAPTAAAGSRPLPEPRRPRTLRIPRVRRVILRDPVDQVAAEQLEAVLRGTGVVEAGVVLAEAVLRDRLVAEPLWQHVLRAAAIALDEARRSLAATQEQASHALAASNVRCPRCSAAELCAGHQQVLWRWWDIRDTRAVDVVNLVVAALAAGAPKPASARPGRRRP